jgi:hypothetical protein
MECNVRELKEKILRGFFIERFKRKPEEDPSYFGEWKERFFDRPPPEVFMDSESRMAYIKVLTEAIEKCCGRD